jgi:diguanylate cyclase (GGDEF)-like protein
VCAWGPHANGHRTDAAFARSLEAALARGGDGEQSSAAVLDDSALAAPLRARGRRIGVLVLAPGEAVPFTADEVRLVELLAAVAAVALENARLYQEVERLATVDPLTDLYNYRYFHRVLALEVARARRLTYPVGLLMGDLDRFKRVNDRHGHPKADEVLRAVARVAREQLRQTDVLARLGGEEFGVVLPNVGTQALGLVAEKLRVAVGAVRVPTGRGRSAVQVTMSLGGVSLPAGRVDAATLVELADRALLRAKHAGRDRVVIDPSGEPG